MSILLVDDDISILETVSDILCTNKFDVVTASSAIKALDILNEKSSEIDLIISDVKMPEMSGLELLIKIKSQNYIKDIPIIFLTANGADKENLKVSFKHGLFDYIEKPFDTNNLLTAINEGLIESTHRNKTLDFISSTNIESETTFLKNQISKLSNHTLRHAATKIHTLISLTEKKVLSQESAISILYTLKEDLFDASIDIQESLLEDDINEVKLLPIKLKEIVYKAKTIFLIDDDDLTNTFNSYVCKKNLQANIHIFSDPILAIQTLEENQIIPDLIFLDIQMPNISGFDFLEYLTKYEKKNLSVPDVIMLSSSRDPKEISRSLSYDFVIGYETKPLGSKFFDRD